MAAVPLGRANKTFLIAEVGQAHEGSLGMAHAFVASAAGAGADAIKFQTHIASAESTLDEPFRIALSGQDNTRYAYWQRMEFSRDQWQELANHAAEEGIAFLSSPFSAEAVDLLRGIGVTMWKIGSGEVFSADTLNAVIDAGGPLFVSTGMSAWQDIDDLVAILQRRNADFVLMQCTSQYPTALEQVGLNVLDEMRHRYGCAVGLSDHSGSPYPAIAAIARGAAAVEMHVTFDRRMYGPDVGASLTFEEFAAVARARDAISIMDANPVDKSSMALELADMKRAFGKSLVARLPLPAGTVVARDDLTTKKPALGIAPDDIERVVGRRLRRGVSPDRLLSWDDLEVDDYADREIKNR